MANPFKNGIWPGMQALGMTDPNMVQAGNGQHPFFGSVSPEMIDKLLGKWGQGNNRPGRFENPKGERPDKGGGGGGNVDVIQAGTGGAPIPVDPRGADKSGMAGGGGDGAFSWGPWLDAYGRVDNRDLGSVMDTLWRKYGGDNAQDYGNIPWDKWFGKDAGKKKKFGGLLGGLGDFNGYGGQY